MNHGVSVYMGTFGVLWASGGGFRRRLQEGGYKPIVVSLSKMPKIEQGI